VTPEEPCASTRTLREAEAAGNISVVDVEQQLLGKSSGGNRPSDVRLSDVTLSNVPLHDVALPGITLGDIPLPVARPDGSVGKEFISPHVAEEACVRVSVRFLCGECPVLSSIHLRH
jgi:hypothetical protein